MPNLPTETIGRPKPNHASEQFRANHCRKLAAEAWFNGERHRAESLCRQADAIETRIEEEIIEGGTMAARSR